MRNIHQALFVLLLLASCYTKKEDINPSLYGDWKLVYLTGCGVAGCNGGPVSNNSTITIRSNTWKEFRADTLYFLQTFQLRGDTLIYDSGSRDIFRFDKNKLIVTSDRINPTIREYVKK